MEAKASAIHEEAARLSCAVLASWESEIEEHGGMVAVDPIITRHFAILLTKHNADLARLRGEVEEQTRMADEYGKRLDQEIGLTAKLSARIAELESVVAACRPLVAACEEEFETFDPASKGEVMSGVQSDMPCAITFELLRAATAALAGAAR